VTAALALPLDPSPERRVVISQPMLFPWVGMLEQIRLADVFVHYDDVQLSTGGFINRVEVKTHQGMRWMTIPLAETRHGQTIRDVRVSTKEKFRKRHLAMLAQEYARAPHVADMLALVERVYSNDTDRLVDLLTASVTELSAYFGLHAGREALWSSALGVPGKGTERVLDVVRRLSGTVYVTGHGARDYLDHESFDRAGVRVEYIDYRKRPYPQLHGPFDPHVSALDLVANVGRAGRFVLCSGTVPWKEFVNR
jgi:hypothetical protein